MGFYPRNPDIETNLQTDVSGTTAKEDFLARVTLAGALAADDNKYVTATDMKVGAYTLAATAPGDGLAHNVTVKHTAGDTADTLGTVTVVGTNVAGASISETITPQSGTTVQGAKAFKTITSVTGAGWVIDAVEGTEDTIEVGFGEKLGLPYLGTTNTVLLAALAGVKEGTAPTVVRDSDELEKNTIDLNSSLAGTDVDVWLIV